ncbi:hypothetical protein GHT06_011339 [Daphnia sinensis]|uniref:Uncharacterized protein n=1 Tax=Daphnia sinensis TaxID=1820382 RepID=A0AAD5L2K7_9CRUS|nr:hypothetical protein GHT06_011339 [Daphnia sinensis]
MTIRQTVIIALSLFILQANFVLPSPTSKHLVKRQTLQRDSTLFLDSVGDLVIGVINTGLRSVAALITSGNEATQKMAVAVGSAALPPLLNVSRAFTRVQQSSTRLFNNTQAVLPEPGTLRDVTRRIAQGIQPAIGLVGQSVNSTFRGSSGNRLFGGQGNTTRVNPNDIEIPDEFADFENN